MNITQTDQRNVPGNSMNAFQICDRQFGKRSNKQNGPSAEWVQEQKNRKILTYISLYGLSDKTIIRIVKKYQENE